MSDTPKDDSDRTVFRPPPARAPDIPGFSPRPLGALASAPVAAVAPSSGPEASSGATEIVFDFADAEPELYGPEPLVAAASRLIRLGNQLRRLPVAPALNPLRQLVIRELDSFVKRAQALALEPGTVQLAHYILCAFVDDCVMTTPWGAASIWSQHSLLAAYHNDVQGGERLFQFAERMEQNPRREPRIAELLYLCLSLGFEGRMALDPRGASLLQQHRQGLHGAIMSGRAARPELSPQWRGKEAANFVQSFPVPLWAVFAAFGVAALLIFAALLFRLNSRSDAAIAALNDVVGTQQVAAAPGAPLPALDRIRAILQPDIDARRVEVLSEGGDYVIRMIGQGLFESASAELASDYSATFGRIAEAANIAGGDLRIFGHTDNQPPGVSLAYPSNQALSEARAETVGYGIVDAGIPEARISIQGLADSQPIASNASPEGRRQNRRVEVRVAANPVFQ
jgi:type VI secretion system protein ImpK